MRPLTLALRAHRADDKIVAVLSPQAGRGGMPVNVYVSATPSSASRRCRGPRSEAPGR
ncbi:hypothetical protein CHKEEEPN_4739 [Methylorubrum podarium]|jgi:hypothetical protein|nr:hypothetical protein CHKEEEPN_4739 [Methylorubrum podarium]